MEKRKLRLLDLPSDCTYTLPYVCTSWLKQYGLTNQELDTLEVCWSESMGLLIFPIVKENILIGYVGRRFAGEGKKYMIRGTKTNFTEIYGRGSTLVFTEDLVSAIKVARVTSAMPLYGVFLTVIPEGYSKYYLWLDKDKQKSSVEQCRKWKQYGYNINPIITDLDPKEYNETQIKELT